ncbi:MAG: hypothetical protein AAB541_04190 [Patescibacteria group bacterium]
MAMHTFNYDVPTGTEVRKEVAGGQITFFHNSDLSGDVTIVSKSAEGIVNGELDVPGEAIVEFVAEYVKKQRISQIEDAEPTEVFGIT